MIIPSGKGRNGELSIAIILLKSGNTFLASFQEYITEHQLKQQADTIPPIRGRALIESHSLSEK